MSKPRKNNLRNNTSLLTNNETQPSTSGSSNTIVREEEAVGSSESGVQTRSKRKMEASLKSKKTFPKKKDSKNTKREVGGLMCQNNLRSSSRNSCASNVPKNNRQKTVSNADHGSTTSSTIEDIIVDKTSNKSKQVKKRKLSTGREEATTSTKNKEINKQEQIEEELKCVICSEIFVYAVTLNCSHSFCQYCITKWRKNNSTCPICRQNIISQTSTLVLDKCVEKVLESSNQEMKEHRKEIIDYREKNKEPEPSNGNSQQVNTNRFPVHFSDSSTDGSFYNDLFDDYQENEFFYLNNDYELEHDMGFDDDDYVNESEEEYEGEVEENEEEGEEEVEGSDSDIDEEDYASYEEECSEEVEEEEGEYEGEEGDEEYEEEDYNDDEDDEGSYEVDCDEEEEQQESDEYENNIRRCYNCGSETHYARDCPKKTPYNGRSGGYYGGYGVCFKCKRKGHWKNSCPYNN